ncbi:hypothetical protein GEMRC1_013811 [Eukaryota sp. GEM-RC1]
MGIKTLLTIFELISNNKLTLNIDISPHLIDFSRGSICYTPSQMSNDELVLLVDFLRQNRDIKHFECPLYQIDTDDDVFSLQARGDYVTKVTVEVVSSLRCFMECFRFKKLTLKKCEFTKESITALCDFIKSNNSLTSVDFSDFKFVKLTQHGTYQRIDNFDSYDHYSNLINAIQCNSRLTKVTLSNHDMGVKTLLTIFELVSTNKITSNIVVSPHFIDVSRGSICYTPSQIGNDVLVLLVVFQYQKLTLTKCKFTKESITDLCDLIRSNNSLTSVDFSDFCFVKLTRNGTYQWIGDFDSYEHCSNLINAIQCNSRLTKVTLSNCNMCIKTLLTIFELVSTNTLTSNIEISPHLIDFSRGSICYTPSQMSNDELVLMVDFLRQNRDIKHFECPLYQLDTGDDVFCLQARGHYQYRKTVTVEVVSSLRCFLEYFSIKKLTLKKCKFTKESITALCDFIKSNNSLTSVDFSDFIFDELTKYGRYHMIDNFDSYDPYSNLINAIQCNSRLTKVTLSNFDMGIKTLLHIFELISNNKLTLNIDISPHSIDFSRGSICYTPSQMSNDELVLMVDVLRQNRDIKHFECPLYQIDTDDDVFCLQGIEDNIPKVIVEVVSSLRCFLECFSIKKLTLKNCEFTKESITALCDFIKSNNSLTSVAFSDFKFVTESTNAKIGWVTRCGTYQKIDNFDFYDDYSNLINAIQCNSRLTTVTLSNCNMGIKTLLTIFELVSTNKLISNIEISPHLIDFSNGCIFYNNRVENDDLICLLNGLKSNIPVKSVDCKGSLSITLTGLIALFEILSYNKSFIDVDISPHLINVGNGVFCFNGNCSSKLTITTDECTSLLNFLNCFNIKKLSFEGCLFTDESFSILCDSIKAHNSLTSVELWDCHLSDSGFMNVISALQFKSCFKIIDIDRSYVKPKSLFRCLDVILAGKLTPTIEVSNCVINVETGVLNLSFESDTQVTADEVSSLQCFLQCFNMKKLILHSCIFTNESATVIFAISLVPSQNLQMYFLPSITVLDLRCIIGSKGARALAEALKVNSTITYINLTQNSIGPERTRVLVEVLKVNSTITHVDLGDNSIGPEGARALADVLKVNSTIVEIYLKSNSIGPEGARALADSLKVNSTITYINLTQNSIGPEGARVLADALKVNSTITHVDLGDNYIGPEGARALADALKVNSTIVDIYLTQNSIGPEGARALAGALKVNFSVTSVDLSYNHIEIEGVRALADSLKVNSTITYISLTQNSIGPEGARALADALKANSTITDIYLGDNIIDTEGARALADALKVNSTITYINLSHTSIGPEGARALADSLKVNSTITCEYPEYNGSW